MQQQAATERVHANQGAMSRNILATFIFVDENSVEQVYTCLRSDQSLLQAYLGQHFGALSLDYSVNHGDVTIPKEESVREFRQKYPNYLSLPWESQYILIAKSILKPGGSRNTTDKESHTIYLEKETVFFNTNEGLLTDKIFFKYKNLHLLADKALYKLLKKLTYSPEKQ